MVDRARTQDVAREYSGQPDDLQQRTLDQFGYKENMYIPEQHSGTAITPGLQYMGKGCEEERHDDGAGPSERGYLKVLRRRSGGFVGVGFEGVDEGPDEEGGEEALADNGERREPWVVVGLLEPRGQESAGCYETGGDEKREDCLDVAQLYVCSSMAVERGRRDRVIVETADFSCVRIDKRDTPSSSLFITTAPTNTSTSTSNNTDTNTNTNTSTHPNRITKIGPSNR